MTSHTPDPRRLDAAAFAAEAASLEGRWPLAGFERLTDGVPQAGEVSWSARGQLRPVAGGEAEVWLHVAARAHVRCDCQRCLQPVLLNLDAVRALRFVADEATAEALDAESEDDVLALPRSLDLHELIEDELLLALPLVPMHGHCPQPLPMSAGEIEPDGEQSSKPFAGLAGLGRRDGDKG
jgi:uncharacterized protein